MADEVIAKLGEMFVARKDAYAFQVADGSWRAAQDNEQRPLPFTMTGLRDHLAGSRTLGHYVVNQDNQTKIFCFDIDLRKMVRGTEEDARPTYLKVWGEEPALIDPRGCYLEHGDDADLLKIRDQLRFQMRALAEGLGHAVWRVTGKQVAVVDSGRKGLHVYALYGDLTDAKVVRADAEKVLEQLGFIPTKGSNFFMHRTDYDCFEIELFPKQVDMDGKEYGNLLGLPLGIHRSTGVRKDFCDLRVGMDRGWQSVNPMEVLEKGFLPWGAERPASVPAPVVAPSGPLWTTPGHPSTCPSCGSSQVRWQWSPDNDATDESATCYRCGWQEQRAYLPGSQVESDGGDGDVTQGGAPTNSSSANSSKSKGRSRRRPKPSWDGGDFSLLAQE